MDYFPDNMMRRMLLKSISLQPPSPWPWAAGRTAHYWMNIGDEYERRFRIARRAADSPGTRKGLRRLPISR